MCVYTYIYIYIYIYIRTGAGTNGYLVSFPSAVPGSTLLCSSRTKRGKERSTQEAHAPVQF